MSQYLSPRLSQVGSPVHTKVQHIKYNGSSLWEEGATIIYIGVTLSLGVNLPLPKALESGGIYWVG